MATTRAQPDRTNAAIRGGRDAAHPGTAEFTAPPGDVAGNDGLRRALATMVAEGSYAGRPEWEAIGRQVLTLADRDGWRWRRHASEYQDAYVLAAIEFLRDHPESVINARNPWGLVVTRGRFAGEWAVGAQATCGLTDRDPVSHRVRFADVPRVVSLNEQRQARAADSRDLGRPQ